MACSAGTQQKGRREAGLFSFRGETCASTCSVLASVFGDDRAAPAEAVVQADLDGVLVVAKPGADHVGRAGRDGGLAEVVILVFGLGGPVRREHVFQAGADSVAVLAVA